MNHSRLQTQQRPGLKKGVLGSLSAAYNFLAYDFEFVPDRRHDDKFFPTRLSRAASGFRLGRTRGRDDYPLRPPPPARRRTWQREVTGDLRGKSFFEESPPGNCSEARGGRERNPFDDAHNAENQEDENEDDGPYHVFPKRQKWVVIVIIGMAGLFSGLSSNIYNPSLDAIARARHHLSTLVLLGAKCLQYTDTNTQDLKVNNSQVSLTITSYLIIQAVSPLLWGPMSDTLGRRPVYIASFAVYIAANIALSFSPNYPVLLIFRGVQAAGSASTVSIGEHLFSSSPRLPKAETDNSLKVMESSRTSLQRPREAHSSASTKPVRPLRV